MEHFNELPEPTEEQLLRLQLNYTEADLQRAHDDNRRLRKRVARLEAVVGIEEAA